MAHGDHIYVERDIIIHHGIDCGDGTVIEYGRDDEKWNCVVREVTMETFRKDGEVKIRLYQGPINAPEDVIKLARSRLNERDYSLWANNCEHFATWCKAGNHHSKQVEDVLNGFLIGGCILVAIGAIAIVTTIAIAAQEEAEREKRKLT